MNNPKTTILGWLVLIGAVINSAVGILDSDPTTNLDIAEIIAALAGLGLIAAKDNNK